MTRRERDSFPAFLAALLLFFGAPSPQARAAGREGPLLATLPATVRKTVESQLNGGRLLEATPTNENGQVVYECEMRLRGVGRSFTVGGDGSLLARQVFLAEVPAAVRGTLQRETAGGRLDEIYWINEEGEPAYYAEFTRRKEARSLTVAPDGWLDSREVALEEAPAPVQRAIRASLGNRSPLQIDRADDGDSITYEVTDSVAGRERVWVFNEDGSVAAEPIALSELPTAARAILTRKAAGGRIIHVFRFPHEGQLLFEVTFVRQSTRSVCTTDQTGKIVGEELPLSALPPLLRAAISARAAGRFLVRIERTPGESGDDYDVYLRQNGKQEVVTFGLDGKEK